MVNNPNNKLPAKFFSQARGAVLDALPPDSLAIVSASLPLSASQHLINKWQQNADFFYLTGIEQQDCSLLLVNSPYSNQEVILFMPEVDELKETWEGKTLRPAQAEKISAITEVKTNGKLLATLERLLPKITNFYIQGSQSSFSAGLSPYELMIKSAIERYPQLRPASLSQILARLRWQKQPEEIALIKQAIAITSASLKKIAPKINPGLHEYQLEAMLDYEYKNAGCKHQAFLPVIGSGKNSTVLHHHAGGKRLTADSAVLIDTGAKWGNYAADITRVFPVSKKFSSRAEDIYEINLAIQQAIINNLAAGQTLREIGKLAQAIQTDLFIKNKLAKNRDQAKLLIKHSIGHSLGLDVHDPTAPDWSLTKGCVITIEPGIYLPEENIGVRIEDDILFDQKQIVNLSADLPKKTSDIYQLVSN